MPDSNGFPDIFLMYFSVYSLIIVRTPIIIIGIIIIIIVVSLLN